MTPRTGANEPRDHRVPSVPPAPGPLPAGPGAAPPPSVPRITASGEQPAVAPPPGAGDGGAGGGGSGGAGGDGGAGGEELWRPDPATVADAGVTALRQWLADAHGVDTGPPGDPGGYRRLWEWSVGEPAAFWAAFARWARVEFDAPYTDVLPDPAMPGTVWFPGARLNYARHALRHGGDGDPARPAIVHLDEHLAPREISWAELTARIAAFAGWLREAGVGPGDRVAAYLPNVPEAVIAMLGCAAVGAVWTSCAPDFGARAVLDRLRRTAPVVLVAGDGQRYAGREHPREDVVADLRRELTSVRHVVHVPVLGSPAPEGAVEWREVMARGDEPRYADLPFDHPLWIVYSSGTTGLPKAIVQGQGGILLEHLKQALVHMDLGPRDRFLWYTSTGWMMWNFLVSGLLAGATIVLYDGAPAHPGPDALWTVAERSGATILGTSSAYLLACRNQGLRPRETHDLSAVRCIGATGSPLPADGFRWVYRDAAPGVWLASITGGTDVCSAFAGGVPILPVHAGEIQARCLGADLHAWDEHGREVVGEAGELVVTTPLPSMPLYFWDDPGQKAYRDAYFSKFPGVWRHGDRITVTARGTVVVHGRSDATLNRQGVRMGSADIHDAVERLPEIREALVVGVEEPDGGYWMPLFVVPAEGVTLDDELRERIRRTIREELSPRHVPDEIVAAPGVPRTLTGKRIEVPVKKLMQGHPVGSAVNPGSVDHPELLEFYAEFARSRRGRSASGGSGRSS